MLSVRKVTIGPHTLVCSNIFELRISRKFLSTTKVAKRYVGSIIYLLCILVVTLFLSDVPAVTSTKNYNNHQKYERGDVIGEQDI